MKSKLLIVAFIAILLCSALNVALTMAQCPTCHGTGKVVCSYCDGTGEITVEEGGVCETCGGSGVLTPTITTKSSSVGLSGGKVSVVATFENEEDVVAYGKVTVEVEAESAKYTATSSRTSFSPHEETEVNVIIEGISDADYNKLVEEVHIGDTVIERLRFSPRILLSEVEDVVCPHCDGTGVGSVTTECPYCGGTGFIDCPTCGGSGVEAGEQNGALDIGGTVYGVAAVAVVAGVAIAAFVVVKKRKVSEKDLRKLPPTEFQNWVLKKLGGKSSSSGDARMGIDGYTLEGQPVSIKQADNVGRNVIENFAAAMGRRQAKDGMIVAFSFATDAIRGRVRAKLNYGLEIQMVTVKELIEGRNIPL
jgi:hypothetical protein